MSFLKKLFIANIILFLFVLAFVVFTIFKFESFLNTPASSKHKQLYIEIAKNQSIPSIVDTLKNKGIITRSDWFYYYLRLSGQAKHLKAGLHLFYTDYTPKQVLNELVSPKIYTTKITVIAGYNIKKIADVLSKAGFDGRKLLKLNDNESFIKRCSGFDKAKSLEGFLYPDTYFVSKDDKVESILLLMCKQFRDKFKKLTGRSDFKEDDYKKLIVASIIQKEATDKKDMRLVAGVIYNRLKKGMYLQMDSTRFDDRFNTYLHKGLPPEPICNPSYDALAAAYNPQKTDYLYFISKKDGSMIFSKTLKEHNRNIRKYLK